MICEDAEAWLTLQFLPGLGPGRIARLLAHWGRAEEILEHRAEAAARLPGLARILDDDSALNVARDQARRELERIARQDISLISCVSGQYPWALREIADRPILLYVQGEVALLAQPMLAIIGARSASGYGLRTARRFAAAAAERGLAVVSGAAYGIDAAAHQGALQAGGKTVAVLGCGVDVAYPAAHRGLLRDIAQSGAVVSEFPLGTRPEAFRFPIRNRIISGLSRAVLVVEAGEKSGSLITARLALDQGREVLAIPGSIDSLKSSGAHWLIQQGATLIQRVEDVFEAMAWSVPAGTNDKAAPSPEVPLAPEERQVLQALDAYPADIDRIAQQCGLALTALQPLLLALELQGLVRRLPGQLYERVRP